MESQPSSHGPVLDDLSDEFTPPSPQVTDPGQIGFDEESQKQIERKWQRVRCYGFESNGIQFLAPISVYCEILTNLNIAPLPNTPNHFVGLTNVRGNLVPVYQLEPYFKRPTLRRNYAILMGNVQQAGALLVSEKPRQFDLDGFEPIDAQQDSLPQFLDSAISQRYTSNGRNWNLLDHISLFKNLATQTLADQSLND